MPDKVTNIAVIGAQWGDEGKGKIVDALADSANTTVRFHGGHNAGHTIVADGQVFKLALLPSGVVKGSFSVIGSGVALDPWHLKREIHDISQMGVEVSPLVLAISAQAILVFPFHAELDSAREQGDAVNRIGTTKRGIGPAYEDKVGRRAIRTGDLFYPEILREKLASTVHHHNILRGSYGLAPLLVDEILEALKPIATFICPYIKETHEIAKRIRHGRILFEGAQGVMLDVDQGTYPYVTASNSVPSYTTAALGIGYNDKPYVLAVAKAYTTRVGNGPFPTELKDETGAKLQKIGREVGVNTGRPRRCGWIDTVQLRHAVLAAGVDAIALTKLDILDTFKEINICTHYMLDGKMIADFPSNEFVQRRVEPVYETIPGWNESCVGVKSFNALPKNARAYVNRLEDLLGVPVSMISTSPDRRDLLVRV